ncbi:MAG: hypothetical protein EBZ78_12980, partial [Verrucomicrobia bacterium]|nr:hypothetical protein [Verrucomicrobiota bacterium]
DDFYDGNNRDAATLYEFWLYFVLREVLQKEMGMREIRLSAGKTGKASPFRDDGINGINLKQGKESVSVYEWEADNQQKVRVHLYYNRSFSRQIGPRDTADELAKSYRSDPQKTGSYSRIFRPDFSLVFFPAPTDPVDMENVVKDEQEAEKKNAIGFLHFDAKYRIVAIRTRKNIWTRKEMKRRPRTPIGAVIFTRCTPIMMQSEERLVPTSFTPGTANGRTRPRPRLRSRPSSAATRKLFPGWELSECCRHHRPRTVMKALTQSLRGWF